MNLVNRFKLLLKYYALSLITVVPNTLVADSISTTNKYAYGENAGWFDFSSIHERATVYNDHLEGHVWSESVGWIRLGTITTGAAHTYTNDAANSYGVNNDGDGNLSGYGWSESAGWISFNPAHSQVTINSSSGDFNGYAWSESLGWIHFQNTTPAYKVTRDIPLPVADFPYLESFESGSAGWYPDSSSLWELGTPANSVIMGASEGVNAWITDLDANYPDNAFEAVVSPVFDFSTFSKDPIITMDVWWHSEDGFDGTVLQSTIDGGTTWVDVGASLDPINWFNSSTIIGLAVIGESGNGWSGRNNTNESTGSGAYVKASHTLIGLAGQTLVQFRVLFASNGSITDNGFAFDNIVIDADFDANGDPDATDPDDDKDGLPDEYEIANGLNQFDANDAGLDPDGDGLTTLEEYNLFPNLNPNDPDSDGDGIDDGLDTDPILTSNNCTDGVLNGAQYVDAIFLDTISSDISCGAIISITVDAPAAVQNPGILRLIAPTITINSGFKVEAGGQLRINPTNSCASCLPAP